MVRLQPIIDRFCGWSGVCSLHGPAHRRQLLFIMRKMKRQVRDFLRRISGHSHSGAQKIVEVVLLAARDGVNYAAKRRSQKSGV